MDLSQLLLRASEWSLHAAKRKGLRAFTSPIGPQRTSYALQLPYRYSLPLMALSGLFHSLVSRSIFLVIVESYGFTDNDEATHEDYDDT
jgi:hypothetical protein